ncbi:MAG: hypothetical protein J6336_07945 [Kiritimatiellae bacterium]|nr:hypothetical protein [Kiritimatiellia bacterium]
MKRMGIALLLVFVFTSISIGIEDSKLKAFLSEDFCRIEGFPLEEFVGLRKYYSVGDEQLYRVLTEIWRENVVAIQTGTPDSQEDGLIRQRLGHVLFFLPECKGVPSVKGFLFDRIESLRGDSLRETAIRSYLRIADADEAREVLLRFLTGKERMSEFGRSGIYAYAEDAWNEASFEKRKAIFTILCDAAAVESPQWSFNMCDAILCKMHAGYRDSALREAMIRRQLALPFQPHYEWLQAKLEGEARRIGKLKREPNQKIVDLYNPRLEDFTDICSTVPTGPAAKPAPKRRLSAWIAVAAAVAAVAAAVGGLLWHGKKRSLGG